MNVIHFIIPVTYAASQTGAVKFNISRPNVHV
jgi:hypothetical protein